MSLNSTALLTSMQLVLLLTLIKMSIPLSYIVVDLWSLQKVGDFAPPSFRIATQLPVVTISFVVTATITNLKLFNTAAGRQQPVRKWA